MYVGDMKCPGWWPKTNFYPFLFMMMPFGERMKRLKTKFKSSGRQISKLRKIVLGPKHLRSRLSDNINSFDGLTLSWKPGRDLLPRLSPTY